MQERQIHRIFEVSVLLKGLHALIELAGGLALALVSTQQIRHIVGLLTQQELREDPRDFLAFHLLNWAQSFSVETKSFYAFYLALHGIIKLLLVIGLLKEKHWAYPASLIVLGLFIAYQLYRFSYTHSIALVVLSIFDLFVIALIWHEYRLSRR